MSSNSRFISLNSFSDSDYQIFGYSCEESLEYYHTETQFWDCHFVSVSPFVMTGDAMVSKPMPVRKWQNTSFRQTIYIGNVCLWSWKREQIMCNGFPNWKGQPKVLNWKVIPGGTQRLREGQPVLIKISSCLQITWDFCASIKYSEIVPTLCKRRRTRNIYVKNCMNANC